ncbi:MAG: glycosyl hydrolase family 28 protein [Kiritimatiellia bacterium]|jgi:hypothetical protein
MKANAVLSAVALTVTATSVGAAATDAEKNKSGMMNAEATTSDEGASGDVRVLFLGNSITLHGSLPKIGWTNVWGMAASAKEKDYVHLVARGIEEKTGRKAEIKIRNLADFERNYRTWDPDQALADLKDFRPDHLVVALGENVPDFTTIMDAQDFHDAFKRLLQWFARDGANPRGIVRGTFWSNPFKDVQMHRAAKACGFLFVRADVSNQPGMSAKGMFWHEGVQNHPGDQGMAEIARRILARLFPGPGAARFPDPLPLPEATSAGYDPRQMVLALESHEVEVKIDGEMREARAIRVSKNPFNRVWPGFQRPYDQTEPASYIAFEKHAPATVEVRPNGGFTHAVVRPLSAGVKAAVKDGVASFVLPKPGYYSVEFDGTHRTLHVFMDDFRDDAEKQTATRVYGPGIHFAGIVKVESGDRIYIDRSAIVYGRFEGFDVEDVKIFGGGVIDGSVCERVFESCYAPLTPHGIHFYGSKGIAIDGPILLNSANWCAAFFDCEDVDVRNLKIVGQWRYNTDGIDVCNSRRVKIRDCFIRAFDDVISIKGITPFAHKPVEDVSVERCVLWCEWGNTCEPGIETFASAFRGIRFEDCDLIHNAGIAIDVACGGSAIVEDVVYRNIRVELQDDTEPMIYQHRDEQVYDAKGQKGRPILIAVRNDPWTQAGGTGFARHVTIEDIKVTADPGVPPPRVIVKTHPNSKVQHEDIRISGIAINGKAAEAGKDYTD